ncbi:pyruvate dehydrogenase complex dihydrolipoamide acetyltransferase [Larkinella punicea]|uniref:Acetyltransferase component of pyruvate dehydrogenase complex n=1 Tax=Larkinella punicea TaxID=2315727 RepID=A0A368JVZ4_9BACT|nr:pyruvate dehydrogenase complex dihydrolipoamide acetyltransferase [Larkinella punicea]RCR70763.1 pyruvate dehydrogenase complex dihydrolipoamide acetyltransferase [Larkinella punicea]
MAELIRMPKMSDTMTEGVIAEWHKKVGDTVKSGDVLAEVETDKATMDLEAYDEGTLLYIGVEKGQSVPIDGILAVVGKSGEDFKALLDGNGSSNGSAEPKAEAPAEKPTPAPASNGAEQPAPKAPAPAAPAANINASIIRMPKMSDTMTEGTIVAWHKKEGDTVKSGDVLAEVETDKATMDLEAYEEGTLLYIGAKEGTAVAVDDVIAVVGEKGADFQALLQGGDQPAAAAAEPDAPKAEAQPAAAPAETSTGNGHDSRVLASPLAKTIAKEKGVDLAQVQGSGPDGRIVKRDVETFQPAAQPAPAQAAPAPAAKPAAPAPVAQTAPAAQEGGYEDIPLSQMRKTIARRLSESLFTAPHFYLTMEINMDKAMDLRGKVNEVSPVKVSFNDFVLKAAALALKKHPAVNSSWLGDKIRRYSYVNIGVAVAVDEGLLVPVIRNADQKTLSTIAAEVKDLAGKAKDKKLQPKDWEGSTFSISNLGMFGIDEFTAIINPPDSCILAIGSIKQTVKFEGEVAKPTNVMKVTLSCDHRSVDGATGASFLQTFKGLLENPFGMLV